MITHQETPGFNQTDQNVKANIEGWKPSKNDKNAGVGGHGSCCAEMDIWEANSISAALTPHACKTTGQTMCNGDSCGNLASHLLLAAFMY
jgi:cellulose 1,4-beta-cellobiosidase